MSRKGPHLNPAIALALAVATLFAAAASAEIRDSGCAPTAVRVDEQRMEIVCADPFLLNDRAKDRFREVQRFAFPIITQNLQPQLGSQAKLLDYYLELAREAVVHSRVLHVWFDTDYSLSQLYGCDPTNCRAIVALAITHEPVVASPAAEPEFDAVLEQ